MIYSLPERIVQEGTYEFTDPFRYVPDPDVRSAAESVIRQIESDPELSSAFEEGKMLGVLVCRPSCYIAAFSGNVGGRSNIEGFVPPIYDLMAPDGYFKTSEAEITRINWEIAEIEASTELTRQMDSLRRAEADMAEAIDRQKARMAIMKKKRDEIRREVSDPTGYAALIRESQYEKAELKRLKASWESRISEVKEELGKTTSRLNDLKSRRALLSDRLQNWIFDQYIVHNALGEEASIREIFAKEKLTPPGGTGECAAPKLLEYAYRHGLTPIAMGEFWYGKSPETAVRTHGHFYPSCTSKCGPLLNFMMKGLGGKTCDHHLDNSPIIIHEDPDIVIVEKPSGMPSVPGLDGRTSLLEWLDSTISGEIYPVHRLDMDTSGIMIFARNNDAAVNIRRQFEEHSVRKTYMARVSPRLTPAAGRAETQEAGYIDLPLSPDYDERPRQKVDFIQGKPSYTEYEVQQVNQDGSADLLLRPLTGRTHQLRVHCSHTLGLGRPIMGDLLYGAHTVHTDGSVHPCRLCLHASSISFTHPATGIEMEFTSHKLCY